MEPNIQDQPQQIKPTGAATSTARATSDVGQTMTDKVRDAAHVVREQVEDRSAEIINQAKQKAGEVYDQANKRLSEQPAPAGAGVWARFKCWVENQWRWINDDMNLSPHAL